MRTRRTAALLFALAVPLCLLPLARAADEKKSDDLLKPAASGVTTPSADSVQLTPAQLKESGERATKCAERLGWRIGSQAWSFNKGTFFQAVDQVQALGLHYIEAFPDQVVDQDKNVKMNAGQSPEVRSAIKQKLADAGVKLGSFGVTGIPKDEAGARKLFDWARDMGIEAIVSEPGEDQFDLLNKLVDEYGINLAIHNHPQPTHYWNPDTELKVLEGRSKRIGSCADVGHWQRSGVPPIEAMKKLQGRIIETHFKDLNKFGDKGAVDVPWGTGTGDVMGMLREFQRQDGRFTFLVEYENWKPTPPQRVQQIAQGLRYFADACDKLAAQK
jgi:sugar phosphate isomerase/epimerase